MNFNFKDSHSIVSGVRVHTRVNWKFDPELTSELINSPETQVFYTFTNPCFSHMKAYKIKAGYILQQPEDYGIVYETERDFYVSNILNESIKDKYINSTYPRHRIYYGRSCRKIHYLELDEQQLKMLILTGVEIQIDGYKTYYPIIRTVYGDYLYTPNRLFYTKEDLNDYLEIFQIQREHFGKASQSNRCVAGRNIYGKDFVEHIPKMMDDLAKALRAPREWFDFSIEHRDKVQLYLFRNIITDEFADQVYLPLLAYCGEMHRRFYKSGDWVVDYDPVLDCWNPDIRREDGVMARMDRPLHRILDSTSAMYYPLWAVVAHKPTY